MPTNDGGACFLSPFYPAFPDEAAILSALATVRGLEFSILRGIELQRSISVRFPAEVV